MSTTDSIIDASPEPAEPLPEPELPAPGPLPQPEPEMEFAAAAPDPVPPEPEAAPAAEFPAPEPHEHLAAPELTELEPVLKSDPIPQISPAAPQMIEAETPAAAAPGTEMTTPAPLPPRAAAAQMASPPPSDQHRGEREAVTRYPAGAGPRGFVWIEDGRLAATPLPGIASPVDADLELLRNIGVTVLITLTEQDFPQDVLARHGLRNLHFPIADRKAPTTAETDVLVNQMHDMLDTGEVLAVHCLAGLGRTGTILGAYMVKEKGVSAQVALNQIRRFNRQFVQTDDQEDFLMEYEVQQEQTVLRNRAAGGAKLN